MKKIILAASVAAIFGCANPNEYRHWLPGDTTTERQMEILKLLESNGWENVGFTVCEGSILVTATRKKGGEK